MFPTYRYRLVSPPLHDLNDQVGGSPAVQDFGPSIYVDISCSQTVKGDLDSFMESIGYKFVVEDPPNTPAEASGSEIVVSTSVMPVAVSRSTASAGVSTEPARADHKHDILTATAAALVPGDTALEGTAAALARADHKHSLPAFGSSAGTFCAGNDARLSDDRVAYGLRTTTGVVTVSSNSNPTAGQVLTATSESSAGWQDPKMSVFGLDFQYVTSEDVSSTTSSTYQNKVTLVTPALSGTYRVACYCEVAIGTSNYRSLVRLYNVTDLSELCYFDSRDSLSLIYQGKSGFQYVTFTGGSKTFKLQYASQNNSTTVYCRRARIELWRVL